MPSAKCPVCGCEKFYCKNPEDDYDTTALRIADGVAEPADTDAGSDAPRITADTEAYCDRCTWHAPLGDVLKR